MLSTELAFTRPLPANVDAERFVLGSVMLDADKWPLVASAISADDFSLEKHRRIFRNMKIVADRGDGIDRITVADELMKTGQLESVDGLSYLISLDDGLPKIANLDSYVNIVLEKSVLRQAIFSYQRAVDDCMLSQEPVVEVLARLERITEGLVSQTTSRDELAPLGAIVSDGGGALPMLYPPKVGLGVKTPWGRLNQSLHGGSLQPGDMVVIGARPGIGKTTLGCGIALNAALTGKNAVIFSLEMTSISLVHRMAGSHAGVDMLRHSQGLSSEIEVHELSSALADLTDPETCRMWIASSCYTIPAIRAALIRFVSRHSVDLVVIDYLQLIETTGGARNRYEQISEISRQIKRLACEFRAPVVILAQLNREMEKENRAPRPSDMRDSGSIEQDADLILMPYKLPEQNDLDNIRLDLLIAKQRNGPLGKVPMVFQRRYTRFVETN